MAALPEDAQAPAPLQARDCELSPSQLEPQLVPDAACWQAPFPLQAPVFPHGFPGVAVQLFLGSLVPSGTSVQTPCAFPQVLQVPHVAVEQQRPSTQFSEAHSVPAEHIPPRSFFPPHMLPTQSPDTQSALVPHVVRHAPAAASHL